MGISICKVIHVQAGAVILDHVQICDTWSSRLKGLLGKTPADGPCAAWIVPCNFIHTFGMRMTIDVAFVNRQGVVIKIINNLKPWRVAGPVTQAHSVVEYPSGMIDSAQFKEGMAIQLIKAPQQ